MATHRQVLAALQQQTATATTGLSVGATTLQVEVGIGWPPTRTLQALTKMSPPGALISVFDTKSSRDTTRWSPGAVASTIVTATLTSSPTSQTLPAGGTATITLANTPTIGDAVSLYVGPLRTTAAASTTLVNAAGVVVSAGAGATPATMAAALAAAATADTTLPGLVTVTASGSTVTVTSATASALTVSTATGNGGTVTRELTRRRRDVRLSVWAPTIEIRDVVGAAVETMVAQIEMFLGSTGQFASGLPFADGSSGRVMAMNDYQIDDPVLSDLYRYDNIVSIDYPITNVDVLYAVLVPVMQIQINA